MSDQIQIPAPLQFVRKVGIKLEANGETELMLYLTLEGTLNRKGGLAEGEPSPICMGKVSEPILHTWLRQFPEALLEMAGRYELPESEKGNPCYLELILAGEEVETGFGFTFGSEGMGPPEDFVNIIAQLVDLTDPWYTDQIAKRN